MPIPFSGGCACGAVRYECEAAPVFMAYCHCRDCQRASGGAFSPMLAVPAASVTLLQGKPRYHAGQSDSDYCASRGFCPECGTPLFVRSEKAADFLCIKPGSLDDPSWFKPQADLWTRSVQPWMHLDPGLPKFERFPAPADA